MATDPINTESNKSKPLQYLQNPDEIEKVFNQFDANGDGKISVAELGEALKAQGITVMPKDLQRVIEDLDSDRDGFISVKEFAAFCSQGSDDGGAAELRDAFDLYDVDKNGLISAEELHKVLNRLGMKCCPEDCHRMITSVDSDGDGNVNFTEFKKMMTNTVASNGNDA